MNPYHELAAARIALRDAQDRHDETKARMEQQITAQAGGAKALGANEDERKRALTVALHNDPHYVALLHRVREAQAQLDVAQAEVDSVIDVRRIHDREARVRLASALERIAVLEEDDAALDTVLDRVLIKRAA